MWFAARCRTIIQPARTWFALHVVPWPIRASTLVSSVRPVSSRGSRNRGTSGRWDLRKRNPTHRSPAEVDCQITGTDPHRNPTQQTLRTPHGKHPALNTARLQHASTMAEDTIPGGGKTIRSHRWTLPQQRCRVTGSPTRRYQSSRAPRGCDGQALWHPNPSRGVHGDQAVLISCGQQAGTGVSTNLRRCTRVQ